VNALIVLKRCWLFFFFFFFFKVRKGNKSKFYPLCNYGLMCYLLMGLLDWNQL
jgi:hypothetical protein